MRECRGVSGLTNILGPDGKGGRPALRVGGAVGSRSGKANFVGNG